MMNLIYTYQPLFDYFLLAVGFAYSQQMVLRAGVFSIGSSFLTFGAARNAIAITPSMFMGWRNRKPRPLAGSVGSIFLGSREYRAFAAE